MDQAGPERYYQPYLSGATTSPVLTVSIGIKMHWNEHRNKRMSENP